MRINDVYVFRVIAIYNLSFTIYDTFYGRIDNSECTVHSEHNKQKEKSDKCKVKREYCLGTASK